MANIKSAKKRIEIAKANTLRNKANKSRMKTAIKKFEITLGNGDAENIRRAYTEAISIIDKTASKGIIHKNKAARHKAALALKLNAVSK
ncbi:30S ribosomal protein S20 [Mahella sp.]|uniref:30S ribosomal protein S20 n=1 Tax=Mahella sp. TaxID=2798721 RepID=UPI0025C5D93F|nr:30S ribosomal protein S20 [Mahella sp.]MBZ4666527.1 ribosomal protein [Mahella sp.]MDK2903375.1 small subunit ribosomal protein [Clostridiales bacterium]